MITIIRYLEKASRRLIGSVLIFRLRIIKKWNYSLLTQESVVLTARQIRKAGRLYKFSMETLNDPKLLKKVLYSEVWEVQRGFFIMGLLWYGWCFWY
jgi:hypothetical protein